MITHSKKKRKINEIQFYHFNQIANLHALQKLVRCCLPAILLFIYFINEIIIRFVQLNLVQCALNQAFASFSFSSIIIYFSANIATPIARINAGLVTPTKKRVSTIRRYIVFILGVQRERKVFAVVYDYFETLVVNDRPESNIAIVIGSRAWKFKVNYVCACYID